MTRTLRLPVFDAEPDRTGPDPVWAEGHEAGLAEARAESASRLARETARAAEILSDLALQRADIERAVLAALAPLFDAVTDAILPELAARALGPVLTDLLTEAARQDLATSPVLRAAPETAVELSVLTLPETLLGGIRSDPSLREGEIVLVIGGQETCLDLDSARSAIAEALATFATSPERTTAHG